MKDDRRYMSFEQRAQDDPRYRGTVEKNVPCVETCSCGKTVLYAKGQRVTMDGNPVVCPRNC